MKVSRRILARHIASQLIAGTDKRRVVTALAAYVVEHRMQSQLDMIMADIAAALSAQGHVTATVTTAKALDASLKKDVLAYVQQLENTKAVTLDERVDSSILGGIIVETPKHRYDTSVATKLKRLKNA